MSGFKRAFIVSHTHWDREWYQTFHRFRIDMSRVIRGVLDKLDDDPEFRHFLLDGQAVLLEDHLEMFPEDRERLVAHARAGRLSLGPWYILPDEFLVSAEAHARNILIGHQVAEDIGAVQKVGYMPDSFGHVAQVPQLLRQAGIDSFVYTRGNGDEIDALGWEYLWEAPDGSEVIAVNQCGGYCNAAGLGFEEIWHAHTRRELSLERAVDKIRELFEKMAGNTNTAVALINNGCDHFPAQQRFGEVLAALRDAFPDTEFLHAPLAEFIDAVRESKDGLKRHRGELLGGKLHHILSGVWSARMPLKQRNDTCQRWLSDVAEPLAAYGRFVHAWPYPAGPFGYAWKTLLKNHPHDSICGCSIDEVHEEMGPRFDAVEQTAEQCVRRLMLELAPTFAPQPAGDRETILAVANPLPLRRREVLERLVVLQPFGEDLSRLRLLDDKGSDVPFEVVETRFLERFWGVDYRQLLRAEEQHERLGVYLDTFADRIVRPAAEADSADAFVTIRFLAELPALGHGCFRLCADAGAVATSASNEGRVSVEGERIENEFLAVRVHPDGRFDLTDKRTGTTLPGLNLLEDVEDVGDEYDWSPAKRGRTLTSEGLRGQVSVVAAGGLRGTLEAAFVWPLPQGIDRKREARSAATVDCGVRVRVTLDAANPVVDVETVFDNRAGDHRLRAVFPTAVTTDRLVSDGHFHVNDRALARPAGEDWVQPPPGTMPQQEFSLLESPGGGGLALFNLGLPEIEGVIGDDGTAMHLTLLRAVGWLSRDDFPTRRNCNAGPTLATPAAQCIGEQHTHYALMPFAQGWIESGVAAACRRWRIPPLAIQGVAAGHVAGGAELLRCDSNAVRVTAVKKHEQRDTLVVRLHNLTGEATRAPLLFGRPVRGAWNLDLLEVRKGSQAFSGDSVELDVGPHRIETLEIDLDG
jgi:alpha-mannosidase